MTHRVKPLPFKPSRLDGVSERLLVSRFLVGGLSAWRAEGGPIASIEGGKS